MRKKLFVLVSSLVAIAFSGLSMEGPPITGVIYGPTAYTLPAGTWAVGATLSLLAFKSPNVGIAYGVKEGVQIATNLTYDILGYPHVNAKFALGKFDTVPFAILVDGTFNVASAGLSLWTGAVLSIETEKLSIHPFIRFQLVPSFYGRSVLGLVYASSKDLFMLGELDIPAVRVRGGLLFRASPGLELRAWIGGPDFEFMLNLCVLF